MIAVASAAGALGDKGRERLDRAMAIIAGWSPAQDFAALTDKRDRLLAYA